MPSDIDIPWIWYLVRASGLVAFALLYLSIFTGAISQVPPFRIFFLRLHSWNFHCWVSLQALMFVIIHTFSLLLQKIVPFSLKDIFIPFVSNFKTTYVTLGIFGSYLMLVLVFTSYARHLLSYQTWRIIHFSNLALYLFVALHAFYLGTDLKNDIPREIFLWVNGLLLIVLAYNLAYRAWLKIKSNNTQ